LAVPIYKVYSTWRRVLSLINKRSSKSISYSAISPEPHRLLDHPIESVLLYLIFQTNELEPTRKTQPTSWSSVVRLHETPKCQDKRCRDSVVGDNSTLCAFC
jgi:hypothetical protein